LQFKIFNIFLRYIYAGELNLNDKLGEDLLGLLVASDELFLEELFLGDQGYLIEHHAAWLQQNFVFVLHTVFKLSNCKKLKIIAVNPFVKMHKRLLLQRISFT